MLTQLFLAGALITSVLAGPTSTEAWRGITPLRSTRADVERLLGTPAPGQRNADQSEYLHSHPSETLPEGADRAVLRGGPEVEFKTIFPGRGPYRVWTQFQRGGKVTTVSFTLGVQ